MLEFVSNKINLTWDSTKWNFMLFFLALFELNGRDFSFIVTLTLYLVLQCHQLKACSRNIWMEPLSLKWKNNLEVPFGLHSILLNSNYEKSAKCNPTFQRDKFFSILLKHWHVSNYTAMLSKFSFSKKGK